MRRFANEKISIIMGIYNCKDTLATAIESIFAQTYTNWELILYDDGSTDETYNVAKLFEGNHPGEIVLLQGRSNQKLSHALNQCLQHADGDLIARMDGDDISHPERFERQVRYLREHPDIDLVGTQMRKFDETGYHGIQRAPVNPKPEILRGGTPIFHATIMARRKVFDVLGGYTENPMVEGVEDVDLWFRFFEKGFKAATIDEALYDVRMDASALKRRTLRRRIRSIRTRAAGYKRLGFPKRWLIKPACILIAKGIVPYRIKKIILRRNNT